MKKVKLMLLSLSILAVVGGALAFKVKEGNNVCIAAVAGSGSSCAIACPQYTSIESTTENSWLCTVPAQNGQCKDLLADPDGNTFLQCAGSPVRSTVE